MKIFEHKRIREIKSEHWREAVIRLQNAIDIENEKLQDGLLDDYPQEKAYAEGMIEAYENALDVIEDKINPTPMRNS